MNAETLEALKASVAKWQKNTTVETLKDVDIGAKNCPLCLIYLLPRLIGEDCGGPCHGCPVMERTGFGGCRTTPYDDVDEAHFAWEQAVDDDADVATLIDARNEFLRAARAEAEFLKSLLPQTEETTK